ncbi:MAG: T9SS C-terminal target domain-containing protein [Bacteroidetes bacterium]|jgi:Secretion system C-terminal sorting domain|nr:MAG: T9SS C-terminal target domain-containing protein [Bacteroidota bacterium]
MKKYLFWASLILLGAGGLSAQTIDRQVIGAAGTTFQTASIHLDFTVGESVVPTVEAGSFILNQGFQQGDLNKVGIEDLAEVKYVLFPNPTYGLVTLQLESAKNLSLSLEVTDASGRIVAIPRQQLLLTGSLETRIDLSPLAEATYFITLREENGQGVHTFRIQKLN